LKKWRATIAEGPLSSHPREEAGEEQENQETDRRIMPLERQSCENKRTWVKGGRQKEGGERQFTGRKRQILLQQESC